MVISKLNFLRTLLLLDNPIKTIDPNIFTSIWQTLTTLHISLSGAQKWPVAFRQLSSVRDFYVEDFHQGPPLDAFYGFEDTLQTLRLSKTPWFFCPTNSFPDCSCYLAQIYLLRPTMPYSMIVGRSIPRSPACRSALIPIRTVELLAINYNQFPNMFEMCPNLQKIRITQSNITFNDDFLIPENTSLVILSIQDSKLWTVPSCVNKFPLLQECYFDGNRIHTVEMHAFNNLRRLRTLHLNRNPIVFVSREAFWKLPSLRTLKLGQTQLTTIPEAVESLPGLITLDLQYRSISCDCNHGWLKGWAMTSPLVTSESGQLVGTCDGGKEPIRIFLNTTLQFCVFW